MSIFKKKTEDIITEDTVINDTAENETKKKSKKAKFLIPLIFVIIAAVGIAIAFLFDTDSKTNTLSIGSIKVNLYELFDSDYNKVIKLPDEKYGPLTDDPPAIVSLPDQVTTKTVWLENSGKNDAYVYIKVGIPAAVVDGEEQNLFVLLDNSGREGINEGWHLATDEAERVVDEDTGLVTNYYLYYYDTALEPDTESKPLFNSVQMINYENSTIQKVTETFDIYKYAEENNLTKVETDGWHRLTDAKTLEQLKHANYNLVSAIVFGGLFETYIYNEADTSFDHETYLHYVYANNCLEKYGLPIVEEQFGDSDVDLIGFFNPYVFYLGKLSNADSMYLLVNLKEDFVSDDGTVFPAGLYSYNCVPQSIEFYEETSLNGVTLEMPVNSYAIQTSGVDFSDPYDVFDKYFVEKEEYNPEEPDEPEEKADSLTTKTIDSGTNLSSVVMYGTTSDNDYSKYYVKVSDDTSIWFLNNTVTSLGNIDDMEETLGTDTITSGTYMGVLNNNHGIINSFLMKAGFLGYQPAVFGTMDSGSKKYYTLSSSPYVDISCLDSSSFKSAPDTNALRVITTAYTDANGYTWQPGVYIPVWEDTDGNYYHYNYTFPTSVELTETFSARNENYNTIFTINGKEYNPYDIRIEAGDIRVYDVSDCGLASSLDELKEMYIYNVTNNSSGDYSIESGTLGYVYNKVKIADLLKLQTAFEEDYNDGTYDALIAKITAEADPDDFDSTKNSPWKNWLLCSLYLDDDMYTSLNSLPVVINSDNYELYSTPDSGYKELFQLYDSTFGKGNWTYVSAVDVLFTDKTVHSTTILGSAVTDSYKVDINGNKTTDESSAAGTCYIAECYGMNVSLTIVDDVSVTLTMGSDTITVYKDTTEKSNVMCYNGKYMYSKIGFYNNAPILEDENGYLYVEYEGSNWYMDASGDAFPLTINSDGHYVYADEDGSEMVVTDDMLKGAHLLYINSDGKYAYMDEEDNENILEQPKNVMDYNSMLQDYQPEEVTINKGTYLTSYNMYISLYKNKEGE